MVSKASDDLPDPDSPVNTISFSRGSSRLTFRRLCSRAPRITSESATASEAIGRAQPANGCSHRRTGVGRKCWSGQVADLLGGGVVVGGEIVHGPTVRPRRFGGNRSVVAVRS